MIDIKDFKVGDIAYIKRPYRNDKALHQVQVVKTGRKYITVREYHCETQYSAEDYSPLALVEKVDAGAPSLLFKSEQAYMDYEEQKNLEIWLMRAAYPSGGHKYSLEQLRKVKEILEGKND